MRAKALLPVLMVTNKTICCVLILDYDELALLFYVFFSFEYI
jgi:hypothetical protein